MTSSTTSNNRESGETERLMTEHAQRAKALTLTFQAMLKHAFRSYKVEVTLPEQSTGGGIRSLQHIRLVRSEGVAIIVGEANTKEKCAELRTLGHVIVVNERRFGKDLAIDKDEYLNFIDSATKVLEEFGLRVTVSPAPNAPPPTPEPGAANKTAWLYVACILAALGAAAFLFLNSR